MSRLTAEAAGADAAEQSGAAEQKTEALSNGQNPFKKQFMPTLLAALGGGKQHGGKGAVLGGWWCCYLFRQSV